MTRTRLTAVLAAVFIALAAGAGTTIATHSLFAPTAIVAQFTSATGIYPGDEVRVAGFKVGTVTATRPVGDHAELNLSIEHDVPIPADAKAVIVAQNLISARYVQLTPPYETSGPTMRSGAVVPRERTAVPVEWNEVKAQLDRLATTLGPRDGMLGSPMTRFIDSAANAMDGNGAKLRQTLAQLSGAGRILADGSGNIVDVLRNLQTFVSALRDSNIPMVHFQNRLATLTSLVDNNRSELDAALTNLSTALVDVQRFVAGTRDQTATQVQGLADVTQTVVDNKSALENILHLAPTSLANAYSIYNPDTGSPHGSFVLNTFSNPVALVCSGIGALANVTSSETAKLCAQYLGPALRTVSLNTLPVPLNPYLMKSPNPDNVIYSEPRLAPGGIGPKPGPPESPPAVSAYTGTGNEVAPPGYGQPPAVAPGPSAPAHLPANPSPAVYPGAPVPTPKSLPQLLLPAQEMPPAGPAAPGDGPPG